MFNNEMTYNEKWNTPENRAALSKLERKYFDRSECAPSCPVAWAPEVLEMMETLEKELGFQYNEKTIRGYYIRGNLNSWFLFEPWTSFKSAWIANILHSPADWDAPRGKDGKRPRRSLVKRLLTVAFSPFTPMKYGFKAITVGYINKIRNAIYKPKIRISQIKEKYGELRCYFSTSEAFEVYVDREIRKCEIKLSLKGCYYPIENYWNARTEYAVGTEHRPDLITSSEPRSDGIVYIKETTYRGIMKELGLDLKEIEEKYILKQASKVDPQNV